MFAARHDRWVGYPHSPRECILLDVRGPHGSGSVCLDVRASVHMPPGPTKPDLVDSLLHLNEMDAQILFDSALSPCGGWRNRRQSDVAHRLGGERCSSGSHREFSELDPYVQAVPQHGSKIDGIASTVVIRLIPEIPASRLIQWHNLQCTKVRLLIHKVR